MAELDEKRQPLQRKLGSISSNESEEEKLAHRDMVRPLGKDPSPAPVFIADHELTKEETLSHVALKFYGHATPPYWQLIYEANKDVIGDNPNRVRAGLRLRIPELPEELKK